MKYYAVQFPSNTTLIIKTPVDRIGFLGSLQSYGGVVGRGGTIHNLNLFQSFHEITDPTEKHKRVALTMEDFI